MDKQDLKKEEIRQRLKDVQSLPTLPSIATKLNRMVEDSEVTAVQLGSVIEKDQVLTSKLLKAVNSSFFGFPQRISTVSNAIVLLGFNVIKTLVVTSSIFEIMESSDVGLFEHSLGLIHDLGKIVIRAELPDEYSRMQKMVEDLQIPMQEAETKILGVTHTEIGGWLARRWNLPICLVLPIEYHHTPEDAPEYREQAAIIHFSDILIRAVGFGSGGDPWVPPLDHKAWDRIKFGKAEGMDILKELEEKIIDLQDFTMEIHKTEEDNGSDLLGSS